MGFTPKNGGFLGITQVSEPWDTFVVHEGKKWAGWPSSIHHLW